MLGKENESKCRIHRKRIQADMNIHPESLNTLKLSLEKYKETTNRPL